jgi:galactokinase
MVPTSHPHPKIVTDTLQYFKEQFNQEPEAVFLSPGRINIIGEHVDYNDGFVFPAAIDRYVCFAIQRSSNAHSVWVAKDLGETFQWIPNQPLVPSATLWANYLLGVLYQLEERGIKVPPVEMVFSSSIPMGAGLSSSAALECGFAFALNELFRFGLDPAEIAKIGQQAEHVFVGVKCGIMDQFACVFGERGQAILLDCRSLTHTYYPADLGECTLVLFDTGVKHTHLTSGYNDRRNEVEAGMKIIQQKYPSVRTYRDCTQEMLEEVKQELGLLLYRRCQFVVEEIGRVQKAAIALKEKNHALLGLIMTATHNGLSEDYDVSCPELDFLVEQAIQEAGVYGARMMGGGFGGCTLNLVRQNTVAALQARLSQRYREVFGIELKSYMVNISKGVHRYILKS